MKMSCPICCMPRGRVTTLVGSIDFNKLHVSGVAGCLGMQDKDSGALLFLTAQIRNRSRVYKHKTINICCQVIGTILDNQKSKD